VWLVRRHTRRPRSGVSGFANKWIAQNDMSLLPTVAAIGAGRARSASYLLDAVPLRHQSSRLLHPSPTVLWVVGTVKPRSQLPILQTLTYGPARAALPPSETTTSESVMGSRKTR